MKRYHMEKYQFLINRKALNTDGHEIDLRTGQAGVEKGNGIGFDRIF
mgnify:CR=1 FL=1